MSRRVEANTGGGFSWDFLVSYCDVAEIASRQYHQVCKVLGQQRSTELDCLELALPLRTYAYAVERGGTVNR